MRYNTVRSPLMTKKIDMKNSRGFTLLEMAIVVVILGIGVTAFAYTYDIYLKQQRVEKTKTAVETVSRALSAYYSYNGHYPCPSSPKLVRGNPDYGYEAADKCATQAINIGNCGADGTCIEESVAEIDRPGTVFDHVRFRVRIGAVPFRVLNLDDSDVIDGYGNRITYAVTEHLAMNPADDPYSQFGGGIIIKNSEGQNLQNETLFGESYIPDSSIISGHYIVISHGENGSGAYTSSGTKLPCPPAGPEFNNCDTGEPGASGKAIFIASQTEEGKGADSFDDVTAYFSESDNSLWQVSDSDPLSIYSRALGNIGIGINKTDDIDEKNQINGVARAGEIPSPIPGDPPLGGGKIKTKEICKGNNCFEPGKIAGAGMTCPNGRFAKRVENSGLECSDIIEIGCTGQAAMRGIDANGRPICDNPPGQFCDASTRTVCGQNIGFTSGLDGQIISVSNTVNGDVTGIVTDRLKCNNGFWEFLDSTGACTCVPEQRERTPNCVSGNSGTFHQVNTKICPQGTWTGFLPVYAPYGACTCVDSWQDKDWNCPEGWDANPAGRIFGRRHHACPSSDPFDGGHWECNGPQNSTPQSCWEITSNTCACGKPDETQTLACPGNFTGNLVQTRHFDCSRTPPTWTDWTVDVAQTTCHCEEFTQSRDIGCAPGSGTVPGPATAPLPPEIVAGSLHGRIETKTFKCSPDGTTGVGFTNWVLAANYCVAAQGATCRWSGVGANSTGSDPVGPAANSPCTCGTAPAACSRFNATNNYTNYTSCQCQVAGN